MEGSGAEESLMKWPKVLTLTIVLYDGIPHRAAVTHVQATMLDRMVG